MSRFDPLALAAHAVAIAVAIGIGTYLIVSVPVDEVRRWSEVAPSKPGAKPEVPKAVRPSPPPAPTVLMAEHGAGRVWIYRVRGEPETWRDVTLSYRTSQKDRDSHLVADADFRHAGGKMNIPLGVLAAGQPSHAHTRFPGFFLYVAYLNRPLEIGETFAWEWAWQLPGGQIRPGRVKRYEAVVEAWESVPAAPSVRAPQEAFFTARLALKISYVEDGAIRAAATETVWYAWRYLQVVKIVREGRTPDENFDRIAAELVEHRVQ